jgi:hypothetical protein
MEKTLRKRWSFQYEQIFFCFFPKKIHQKLINELLLVAFFYTYMIIICINEETNATKRDKEPENVIKE